MARPVEFDRKDALSAATQLFWRQGYGATSMSQLLDSMGLSRSSLYATFGDKRQLYIEVLEHFAKGAKRLFQPLNDLDDPKELVKQYLELSFLVHQQQQLKQGCLMVNTVLEQAGVDEELAQLAGSMIQDIERLLVDGFQRAQNAGKLPPQHSPKSLARLLMNLSQGLRVSTRIFDKDYIDDVIKTAMTLIDP